MQLEKSIDFPYLNILVSGGHTMLVYSNSLLNHEIIVTTSDIAVGDYLDKCAKYLGIPWDNEMPAAALEQFASPEINSTSYSLKPPIPLNTREKVHSASFSFSGLESYACRIIRKTPLNLSEKKFFAYQLQYAAFQHICQKTLLALKRLDLSKVKYLVCSGGVARNELLKKMLNDTLMVLQFEHQPTDIKLVYPSPDICSDNAAMIGYTAIQMFKAGYTSSFDVEPIRKWPINQILTVEGWLTKKNKKV